MPFHCFSTLRSRVLLFGCTAILLGAALAMPASGQVVWVDFTSDFHDGDGGAVNGVADWIDELNEATSVARVNAFTAAERQTMQNIIISELERVYAGTNLTFVTSQPPGEHDVIYLGPDNSNTNGLGVAPVDAGNRRTNSYADAFNGAPNGSPGPVARVFTGNFGNHLGFGNNRTSNVIGFANSIGGTAAHELGHTYGLFHHFVYSAAGVSATDADNSNVINTGGDHTQHILNTGSTGNTVSLRQMGGRTLSPFSEVMIDLAGGSQFFGQNNSLDNNPLVDDPIISDTEIGNLDAGATIGTAMPLNFTTGTLSGKEISFMEADLDGSSDVDVFRFDISVDAIFTGHTISAMLGLGNDEFDPTLELLDSAGDRLAYADDLQWRVNNRSNQLRVDAEIGNSSTASQDALLMNIPLTAGTYYLKVAPTSSGSSQTASNDDIYWLITSLELSAPEFLLGDLDGSGAVNNQDIMWFALAIFNRSAYDMMFPGIDPDVVGDYDNDGLISNRDLVGFAAALGF